MTDEEIITALDCCYGFHCEKCPLKGDAHCGQTLKDESIRLIQSLQAEVDKLQEFADALHLSTIRLYDIEVVPFDSVKNWAKTFGIKMIGGSDAL